MKPASPFRVPPDTGGAEGEQFPLGLVGITHTGIQVHLLGIRGVKPLRRNPVGSANMSSKTVQPTGLEKGRGTPPRGAPSLFQT